MARGHWPDDMIDEQKLFELLGLNSGNEIDLDAKDYQQLLNLEAAVETAHQANRIKRFTAKDPQTGEAVAHGYRKVDIEKLMGARS